MKTCPLYDGCCPYAHLEIDAITGEWVNLFCTLSHPERDCDDYAAFMPDDEEEDLP